MTTIYEGMFLLDNQVVREDWKRAKSTVTDLLEKHGATVLSARRWDERKLAYPIKGRLRATYLLSYFQIPTENLPAMTRDLNLDEVVLRYLQLAVDELPEGETELSEAEKAADFTVPAPPPDDAPDPQEESDDEEEGEVSVESEVEAGEGSEEDEMVPAEAGAISAESGSEGGETLAKVEASSAPEVASTDIEEQEQG